MAQLVLPQSRRQFPLISFSIRILHDAHYRHRRSRRLRRLSTSTINNINWLNLADRARVRRAARHQNEFHVIDIDNNIVQFGRNIIKSQTLQH